MILAATTAPAGTSTAFRATRRVRITQGTLSNRSSGAVTVSLALVARDSADGFNVISSYSLAGYDTVSLTGYLADAVLDSGERVFVTASTGSAVDVVLTGEDTP